MRKVFQALFYTPKYGKVDDQVITVRLVATVATVVFCLAAMVIAAYAYFSSDVTSGTNILQSAKFETKVQIQTGDNNEVPVSVITSNYQIHTAQLQGGVEYTVTLQHTSRSTANTGFVIITAENCDYRYHTQQLGRDGNGNTEVITFTLSTTADTTITLLAHWGTSVYYGYEGDSAQYIRDGEPVLIPITPPAEENTESTIGEPSAEESTEPTGGEPSTEENTEPTGSEPSTEENTEPTGSVTPASGDSTTPTTEEAA